MSHRSLPLFTLSLGLIAIVLALAGPGRAENEPTAAAPAEPTAATTSVRIERYEGEPVEGKLKADAVTLKTTTGSITIAMSHVRRITLQRDGHDLGDVVMLTDKSQVRGRVIGDQFKVETDAGEKSFDRQSAREIVVNRDEQLSLLSILIGLLTLTAMEIILGIDNVIFLAIVASKLPKERQPQARRIGLAAALGTRLLLLFTLSFLLGLTKPVFTLPDLPLLHDLESREVSWRDLILLGGGLFLVGKSVLEIHEKVEHANKRMLPDSTEPPARTVSFAHTIVTIAVIDIVFSLDSVITAVGMVEHVWVMVIAMVIAMGVMLWFAGPIANFVEEHPTIKVLALAFLILIGVMLVAEGMGQHLDKGYIYTAMVFAVAVEMVNMQLRGGKKVKPATESAEGHGIAST